MVITASHIDAPDVTARDRSIPTRLSLLEPISLNEIGQGNLQDRLDTKFLFSVTELPSLLNALAAGYRVLEIDGVRLLGYQTLYFDTPDFALYHMQHAGRPDRYKVRARRYVETRETFLEVKHKNSRARTIKNRIPTGELVLEMDEAASAFVAEHLPFSAGGLEAKLWNRFSRITLVSRQTCERVTLDLGLGFGEELISFGFPGVVVAELKQQGLNRSSEFLRQMRLRNIHPTGFSKYCIGAAVLNNSLKHNRFKPELLRAQRISERYLNS